MSNTLFKGTPAKRLRGEVQIPGDKSISHRGIMLGSLAEGTTELSGFLDGADCRSSIACFRSMGIEINQEKDHVVIKGKGLHGLTAPEGILDVGNSGTTTRLISGILAGQNFSSTLNGDASIQKRPMGRIMVPLKEMGAGISSLKDNGCAPLKIEGLRPGDVLQGISYESPVASAQVKSCVLFAGMYADRPTSVTEPTLSRNHTELMASAFGADIKSCDNKCIIQPEPRLLGQKVVIPGDISSAAYFLVAGLICPNADLLIQNVNINPTRAGILKVIEAMGGNLSYENRRTVSGEEVADLHVTSSSLHGTTIEGDIIPALIDELPVIAVMAAFAEGETIIRDAAELKVKESDRIVTVTEGLTAMGADVTPTDDGMIIRGGRMLHSASIKTYMDHRLAMSFAIASLVADGQTTLDHPECVDISYPNFYQTLNQIAEY